MKKIFFGIFLTVCSAGSFSAKAGQFRIYFQGSEGVAIRSDASQATPRAAGYQGAAPLGNNSNLSEPCATCIPGGTASRYYGAGTPNQIVTFQHPYTSKAITIPLVLPVGRPKILTRNDRIIYDYGLLSYRVVVKFLPNGGAEVIYRDP